MLYNEVLMMMIMMMMMSISNAARFVDYSLVLAMHEEENCGSPNRRVQQVSMHPSYDINIYKSYA